MQMSEAARQEFVRKAAWELNLIPEEEMFPTRQGKKKKVEPKSQTAVLAVEKGKLVGKTRVRSRSSSVCSIHKREHSSSPDAQQSPSIQSIPSMVHPPMEDDTTPTGSPTAACPPLVSDYDSMRLLSLLIHTPGNQMETDAQTPPPALAAINLVDNFGQLVNGVCNIINPRFEHIEGALSNMDTQFKLLHETLAKLVTPAAQQQPKPPPTPKRGTFSWDDIVDDLILNNPEGVPMDKLVNEGHNPFTPKEVARQQRDEDAHIKKAQVEGQKYMKEHSLDQDEFPPLPSEVVQPAKPKNRKGKQRAKIIEANAKVPGAGLLREATPTAEAIAPSTVPDHVKGYIKVKQTKLKPMFATVTAAAINQHETQGAFLKAKKQTQKCYDK